MPNDDFYIVCPYYHKILGNQLFCNGLSGDKDFTTEECYNKQIFPTRALRNDFIKKYCTGFNYSNCAIAFINEQLSQIK